MTELSIHLTNINGTGARQLVSSLLPAMRANGTCDLQFCYLSDDEFGNRLEAVLKGAQVVKYRRRLPNALSRLFECLAYRGDPSDTSPLLVLGDVPLRTGRRQILLLHKPGLVAIGPLPGGVQGIKLLVERQILRANLRYTDLVIVQTAHMEARFRSLYPDYAGDVLVLPQPVPVWASRALDPARGRQTDPSAGKLNLFYPAASYPHKNHALLGRLPDGSSDLDEIVGRLALTIDPGSKLAPGLPWVDCVGLLDHERVIEEYLRSDALLFLSRSESFGFPLIEAMTLGLPIVCPDLPYAREICGDQAIYFRDDDPGSLRLAILGLSERILGGWRPDWTDRLKVLPANWGDMVARLLQRIEQMGSQDAEPRSQMAGPRRLWLAQDLKDRPGITQANCSED
ncbi:glycosyltransferase [Rubellimicrobium roseum]|nr:glycosyltransferase [Rubellimicrobium roseum]